MAKSSGLKFAGSILCIVASIVAILLGVIAVMGFPSPNALIEAVLYLAFGLLSLLFSFRIFNKYNATYATLLLVFSIIFIALYVILGLYSAIVGLIMLIGAILIFIDKA